MNSQTIGYTDKDREKLLGTEIYLCRTVSTWKLRILRKRALKFNSLFIIKPSIFNVIMDHRDAACVMCVYVHPQHIYMSNMFSVKVQKFDICQYLYSIMQGKETD